MVGDLFRIAREHHDLIDAATTHLVQRLLHLRAHGISDADDAQKRAIPRDVEEVFCRILDDEIARALHAALLHELGAADDHIAALEAGEVGHDRLHAARDDRLRRAVLRHLPVMILHILLDGDRQRMHGVHFRRRRQEDHLLLLHALSRPDGRDLRDADRDRSRLVENHGVRLGERFHVVAALDEDALLRRRCDGSGDRRRRRKLQAAREVDEEEVQHPLPIARRAVDDRRAEERDRHEHVRHIIGETLHGRASRLRLLDEMDDVRERCVLARLLNLDDELADLDDGTRVDRRLLPLHRGVRLARDRSLVHGSLSADDAAIDTDHLARVRRDAVADLHGFDGDLALHAAVDEPDKALVHVQKTRDLLLRALCSVGSQHFGAVRQREQREARLGLSCEHGGDDRRARQRIGVRSAILHQTHNAILEKVARDRQHEEAAEDLHACECLGRQLFERLHAREAHEREDRLAPIARHVQLWIMRRALLLHALDQAAHEGERQRFLVPDSQRLVADRGGNDALQAADLGAQESALVLREFQRQAN